MDKGARQTAKLRIEERTKLVRNSRELYPRMVISDGGALSTLNFISKLIIYVHRCRYRVIAIFKLNRIFCWQSP